MLSTHHVVLYQVPKRLPHSTWYEIAGKSQKYSTITFPSSACTTVLTYVTDWYFKFFTDLPRKKKYISVYVVQFN